jgi:hypothetical protein
VASAAAGLAGEALASMNSALTRPAVAAQLAGAALLTWSSVSCSPYSIDQLVKDSTTGSLPDDARGQTFVVPMSASLAQVRVG